MRCRSQRGFTLLEIMVAVALLAMGMMVLLDAQTVSMMSTIYAKDLTVATQLARARMAKLEQEIEDKRVRFGLSKSSCQDGNFSDDGKDFKKYKWRYCIKKVKVTIPTNVPGLGDVKDPSGKAGQATALMNSLGVPLNSNTDISSIASSLGPFMTLIQQQMKVIFEQLQESMRELEVVVSWKEGTRTESVKIVTHIFHFNQATGLPDGWPAQPAGGGATP